MTNMIKSTTSLSLRQKIEYILKELRRLQSLIINSPGGPGATELTSNELAAIQNSNSPSGTNTFLTQDDVIANLDYDISETLTGGLWNGQPVYRIVIPFNVPIGDPPAPLTIQHDLNVGVYLRADIVANFLVPDLAEGLTFFPLATIGNTATQPAIVATGFISTERNKIRFEEVVNFTSTIGDFFLIIEYTKAS